MKHLLCTTIAVIYGLLANLVVADERQYGSFIFNTNIPNVLFLMDSIKQGDDFELRKALRSHKINTLILASPGGDVWTGLSLAGIIFDKDLRVLVPREGICASACSYMFFGGKERLSEGDLGVHQFSSSDKTKQANTANTQANSQFTVSEIIGFLNEFNTPRFVLERMFEDREMYWFTMQEKQKLASVTFSLEEDVKEKITQFLFERPKTPESSVTHSFEADKIIEFPVLEEERVSAFQRVLNLLECGVGKADGKYGPATATAFRHVSKSLSIKYQKSLINDPDFFTELSLADKKLCQNFVSYSTYKAYDDAYFEGTKRCLDETPITTNRAIDIANCVWKYDERALSKYSMMIISDLAFERYQDAFALAKNSTVSYYSGAISADQHVENVTTKMGQLIDDRSSRIAEILGIY